MLAPRWLVLGPFWDRLWMLSGLPLELHLGGSGTPSQRQDRPGWRQDRAMLADLASKKPTGQHFGEHFGSFLMYF